MKNIFFLAGMSLLLFSSCGKDDNNNELNSTDQAFMTKASMGNTEEIAAGQLAAEKGSSTAVQEFGQLMVKQHAQAQADLQTLSAGVGWNLSDTLDAEYQALLARLDTLTGYAFDAAYINSLVQHHQNTLDLFEWELNEGQHQSVRAYASQYLPVTHIHLQKADSIRRRY